MEQRKNNRLGGYDYSRPGGYFITICTKEKVYLLGAVVGADVLIGPQVQLSEFGQAAEEVIATIPNIDKYVIMPNHIHMILKINPDNNGPMGTSAPTGSLPSIVRYFKRSVTQVCGRNIWQRSYHDHIIRGEEDYLNIWNYIDTNPAKWMEDCYYEEV